MVEKIEKEYSFWRKNDDLKGHKYSESELAEIDSMTWQDRLMRFENEPLYKSGGKSTLHKCSKGFWTIGFGFNLE